MGSEVTCCQQEDKEREVDLSGMKSIRTPKSQNVQMFKKPEKRSTQATKYSKHLGLSDVIQREDST